MMRATIEADALLQALKTGVAVRKGTLPILSHVLLEAADGCITCTTDDLEATVVARVPATIEQVGAVCVLDEALRAALGGGGTVTLEQSDAGMLVRRGKRSRIRLAVLPAGDFPVAEKLEWHDTGMKAVDVARAIDAVAHAPDPTNARPFGQVVAIVPGKAFATDGIRAARVDMPGYSGPMLQIPVRSLAAFRRHLEPDAVVRYATAGGPLAVAVAATTTDGRRGAVRLFSTPYPDVAHVFPIDEPTGSIVADRMRLRGICARLASVNGGRWPSAVFSVGGDGALLEDRDGVNVEDLDEVLVDWRIAGEFRNGVRLDNLMRTIDAIDTEHVRVDYFAGGGQRWRIQPVGGSLPAEFINVPVTL